MFIDEIYEQILIEKNGKLTTAHVEVIRQKVNFNESLDALCKTFKIIENGYQLFRKRHPEYSEYSFRRYCWVQQVVHGHEAAAETLFKKCNWKLLTLEQLAL